jgi:hypothetical protein
VGWAESQNKKALYYRERNSPWDNYKETLTYYNEEIRKTKLSSWRRYSQEINHIQVSSRLMKIMAKQATNKISTIKLSDAQYSQTGKETLKDLFIVHFPY